MHKHTQKHTHTYAYAYIHTHIYMCMCIYKKYTYAYVYRYVYMYKDIIRPVHSTHTNICRVERRMRLWLKVKPFDSNQAELNIAAMRAMHSKKTISYCKPGVD